MSPLISIIVPVYNSEKTLHRCVDSILNQTFTDWELLLIDDGSKDKSGEICDEYAAKDYRIKVFHKDNGGVSSARNLGLDNAVGKWITFIDSDDFINDEIFELLKNIKSDLVVFNFLVFKNGQIKKQSKCLEDGFYLNNNQVKVMLEKYIHLLIFRVPWGKFFRRELIASLRFDINISVGEDTLFVFEYLKNCRSISVIRKFYYIWEECADFIVKYKLKTDEAICIVNKLYVSYKRLGINSIYISEFLYRFYMSLCQDDFYRREHVWFGNQKVINIWSESKTCFTRKENMLFFLKRFKFICLLLDLLRNLQ